MVACWVLLGALLVAGTAASSHALNVQGSQVVEQVRWLAACLALRACRGARHAEVLACMQAHHVRPPSPPQPQLTKLATFTDDPNPYVTRVLFTPTDVAARGCVRVNERARVRACTGRRPCVPLPRCLLTSKHRKIVQTSPPIPNRIAAT